MDIGRIIQTASRLTGLDPNRLSKAAEKAKAYSGVSTRDAAKATLRSVGVDDSTLTKVQNLLSNPIAGKIASMAGINPHQISDAIDDLKGDGKGYQPGHQSPSDDDRISKLRAGLKKAKHR